MGREERAGREARSKRRLLEWGGDDVRAFELTYQALALFRSAEDDERTHVDLLRALRSVGIPKQEATGNPDLVYYTLEGSASIEITEAGRDLVLKAIKAIQWMGFTLEAKMRAVEILKNAPPVEEPKENHPAA